MTRHDSCVHCRQDWEALGALSAAYLSVLRELIMLLPDWEEGVGPEMEAFLQDGCQAAALCVGVLFTGGLSLALCYVFLVECVLPGSGTLCGGAPYD